MTPATPTLSLAALSATSFRATVDGDSGGTTYRLFYQQAGHNGVVTGATRTNPGNLDATSLADSGQYQVWVVADNGSLSFPAYGFISLVQPASLLAAIRAKWEATPGLVSLGGDLYTSEVPEKLGDDRIDLPYACINLHGTTFDWTFTQRYLELTRVEFHCWSIGCAATELVAANVRAAFDWKNLPFSCGSGLTNVAFHPVDYRVSNEMVRYRDHGVVYRARLTYDSAVSRDLPA